MRHLPFSLVVLGLICATMVLLQTSSCHAYAGRRREGLTDKERVSGFLHKPDSAPQSFDCKARALAYVYAQHIQPNRGKDLSTVADALMLQTLCNYTVEDLTITTTNMRGVVPMAPPSSSSLNNIIRHDVEDSNNTFYVDVNKGSDNNSGSISSPFKTIYRALTASQISETSPSTIIMREGTYYLTSTIQLSSRDSGLTIMSYPGEKVEINGGIPIAIPGWKPYNISSAPRTYASTKHIYEKIPETQSNTTTIQT
eukprot:TRINITY_DN13231_c0_g2_i1.p1 TRINITY_DN13231_c0_g2~~TRINITY_DN13231_c0_g2_i1.p1  ORF type:complete len:262 (-),score=63.18 TRINITY_DN13231_c0_g2_i1:3-767(-)